MTKMRCSCGHVIRDNTDHLPYKAYFHPDEDTYISHDVMTDTLAEYIAARARNQEVEFLRDLDIKRGEDPYRATWRANSLAGAPLPEVIGNLLGAFYEDYERTIYECESCGRLLVQTEGNRYESYLPETDARHVLRSRRHHDPSSNPDEQD